MSMRTLLFAAVLIGAGALYWLNQTPQAQPAQETSNTLKVLVASQPLQAGTLLKDADFREKELAAGEAADAGFVAGEGSMTELRGAMLRRYLDAGERVLKADILRPKDRGFLASVLAPGTRAVSIGVDATTGASGLISPGDLVDVILSQEFPRGETSAGRRVVAETVLSMVRVIAVDQQITQGAPTASAGPLPSGNRVASTVSLQVTPEQAAKVVVAERLGKLTLTVRAVDTDHPGTTLAAADGTPASTRHDQPVASVFGADVSSALSHDEPAISPKLRVIQGDAVNDVTFR